MFEWFTHISQNVKSIQKWLSSQIELGLEFSLYFILDSKSFGTVWRRRFSKLIKVLRFNLPLCLTDIQICHIIFFSIAGYSLQIGAMQWIQCLPKHCLQPLSSSIHSIHSAFLFMWLLHKISAYPIESTSDSKMTQMRTDSNFQVSEGKIFSLLFVNDFKEFFSFDY